MMKISKPVLMNDFMVSPVQFTSLNSVVFKNVKPLYDANEKIILEYEYQSKLEVATRDWIGIFPGGWNTLQQYVTFEWVSQSIPCGSSEQNKENDTELIRRAITFIPKYHVNVVNQTASYQFVYVTKQIEVLGVSTYFRFDVLYESNTELECLVPVSSRIRSTSVSDFGTLVNESSTTSLDVRAVQTSSIHSLQNFDCNGKVNWNKTSLSLNLADGNNGSLFTKKTITIASNGDILDPYISHSEPVFPMSLQMNQCKKCFQIKRGGEILRSQQVLQSKLKIVMERNKVLEERSQEIKKDLERLQCEAKKMKMSFYNVNKEKIAYEKFVKDFIKSLEKDSIVRVMNGNTEILVKKVNYVGMEEHPRDKKTSKRERELKAVIGLQEITIRNLISSLEEKAKSVEELHQTVKLAQAFNDARGDDGGDSVCDTEESMDVAALDGCSEYEFSLTKPQPPEEVAAGTEEVLDDIRRTTEMELKDIGINRSFGDRSSLASADSELDVTSLSVRSFQNQVKSHIKKAHFYDSVKEDCWPFKSPESQAVQAFREKTLNNQLSKTENAEAAIEKHHTISMKMRDSEEELEEGEKEESQNCEVAQNGNHKEISPSFKNFYSETDSDSFTNDDFYDAIEGTSVKSSSFCSEIGWNTMEGNEEEKIDQINETSEDQDHFSLTAIIPQDAVKMTSIEPCSEEGKKDSDKNKKFTCALSIDFSPKRVQIQENQGETLVIDSTEKEDKCLEKIGPRDENRGDSQVFSLHGEKSLITLKQSNKCLEIQITQVEPVEAVSSKSCIQQKMIVKFQGSEESSENGKEPCDTESRSIEKKRSSKFEFNLALTGLGEKYPKPESKDEATASDMSFTSEDNSSEVRLTEPIREKSEENLEAIVLSSPRTEWNDADDLLDDISISDKDTYSGEEQDDVLEDLASDALEMEKSDDEKELEATESTQTVLNKYELNESEVTDLTELTEMTEVTEVTKVTKITEVREITDTPVREKVSNLKLCPESLRYEKNLEFLQNKSEDKKDEGPKEKPSAILIQNGQTKVALIRYQ